MGLHYSTVQILAFLHHFVCIHDLVDCSYIHISRSVGFYIMCGDVELCVCALFVLDNVAYDCVQLKTANYRSLADSCQCQGHQGATYFFGVADF